MTETFPLSRTNFTFAGAGFLNAARKLPAIARRLGSFELFRPRRGRKTADAAQAEADGAFAIEPAQTGKTLEVPADKSILQVLWDNDIEVLHACEEGWCGNCVVDYLSGGVDHRDEVLDDTDRETKIQVCISRALPGEKIVLDL